MELKFLSTLSLRRATSRRLLSRHTGSHFYPRSPCGERPSKCAPISSSSANFYPRSPCGERHGFPAGNLCPVRFLSTLSLRRATISRYTARPLSSYFYPRSPCGERPASRRAISAQSDFYPRSPCGERQQVAAILADIMAISIHALLAESDCKHIRDGQPQPNFYPRSPCGERRSCGRGPR